MNYYIADSHFGHANIIRLCGRPFRDAEEMNNTMIENWNKVVGKDDDVYIGGDFAFRTEDPVRIANLLNGSKHLIKGNHDRKNLKNEKFRKCFVEIRDMLEVADEGTRIILCHYPLTEWNGMYRGAWHFFGHIHNNENEAQKIMRQIPRAVNIGAELIDYTPRTAKWLMENSVSVL